MATAYIHRTPAGAGNQRTWTYSAWVKRGTLGTRQGIINVNGSSNPYFFVEFVASDALNIQDYDGSQDTDLVTTRLFRDVGAWYHIVVAYDTTQSVSTDRIKLYVNGVQETSFSTSTYCAEDFDTQMNSTNELFIGKAATYEFDGCMSWVQVVDGLQLAPTEFGEVDSTSGIWKIKTDVYGTPGTNGFCLKMEDRTNLDLDSSSNAFTFTTTNDVTPTYDNPSNNFCIPNGINGNWAGLNYANFSNGNTTVNYDSSNEGFLDSSMGVAASKWYWEVEMDSTSGTLANIQAYGGVCGIQPNSTSAAAASKSDGYVFFMSTGAIGNNGGETAAWGDTFSAGDVLGIALDITNSKIYFARNGTWMDSGDPTSGATGTGAAYTISATPTSGWYFPVFGKGSTSSYTWTMKTNFGNGYLGTTSVGTSNQDAASIGYFKYAVPAGYYALCTKNIKAYGG